MRRHRPPMLRFSNPPGMSTPPTYSQVVEVNGPHRTVYLAGQTGVDATGKVAEGFRAQAVQVMENLKTALASVGGGFDHVVKLNSYLTKSKPTVRSFARCAGPTSRTSSRFLPRRWCRSRDSPTPPSCSRSRRSRSCRRRRRTSPALTAAAFALATRVEPSLFVCVELTSPRFDGAFSTAQIG